MASTTMNLARPGSPNLSQVPYLPGLDGLRALAVVAVMVYHTNSWLGGGFLGVEVFFVISGYLITLLLMGEREREGHISLGQFWMRRARRLLPALFVVMFIVLVYTTFFFASDLGNVRGDILAGTFYVSNWYQIWIGAGYGDQAAFVPLRHLWSLAVEEQFYLIWPLVMIALIGRGGTRRLVKTAKWLVLFAFLIVVATSVLYHGGPTTDCQITPDAYWQAFGRCFAIDESLYLSTITRATGILLGAAFAMVWRPVAIMRGPLRSAGRALDVVGLVGIGIVAALTFFMHYTLPGGYYEPWLFRGGFLLTDIATLMAIAAVTHRGALLGRALGNPVFLWVGTRSYGLYLYHWPIYQFIRKAAGNPLSVAEFATAMVITVGVTELSYRLIEMPVRRRQVGPWLSELRRSRNPIQRQLVAGVTVVVLGLLTFGVVRASTAPPPTVDENAAGAGGGSSLQDKLNESTGTTIDPAVATTTTTTLPTVTPPTAPGVTTTTTTTTTTTSTTLPSEPIDYLAIGDSVMAGAAPILEERGYFVDAQKNRQMVDMIPLMQKLGDANLFGNPVIIHLGTNGPFTKETLDEFLAPLSDVPNVIIFNVHANRSWTASNNQLLADRDKPNDNIKLIDWNSLAPQCPGNCFGNDGIHVSQAGAKFYADLISDFTGR